jgi:hypothetical protein
MPTPLHQSTSTPARDAPRGAAISNVNSFEKHAQP